MLSLMADLIYMGDRNGNELSDQIFEPPLKRARASF